MSSYILEYKDFLDFWFLALHVRNLGALLCPNNRNKKVNKLKRSVILRFAREVRSQDKL